MPKQKDSQKKSGENRPLCQQCGALLPQEASRCLICGTPRGQKGHKKDPTPTLSVGSPSALYKERRQPRLVALLLTLVLVVAGTGMGTLQYLQFQRLKNQYNTSRAVLYQQDGTHLKMQMAASSEPHLIRSDFSTEGKSASEFSSAITAKNSHDGRFIAYLNDQKTQWDGASGSLYLLDLTLLGGKDPGSTGGVQLSKDPVVDFLFSPKNNTLVYLTREGDLYLCDYSRSARLIAAGNATKRKLDTDVGGLVEFSDSRLLYYKGQSTHAHTLEENRQLVEKQKDKAGTSVDLYKIATNERLARPKSVANEVYDVVSVSKDFERILFTRQDTTPPLAGYTLYSYDENIPDGVEMLASNVVHVVQADATQGRILFLIPNFARMRYEMLFDDDMVDHDSHLTSPEDSDTEDGLLSETDRQTMGTELQTYEEKIQRDQLRIKIRKGISSFKESNYLSYSLIYQPGWNKDPLLLSSDLTNLGDLDQLVISDLDAGYVLFVDAGLDQLRREKLSSWDKERLNYLQDNPFDLKEHLSESIPEALTLYHVGQNALYNIYSELGDRTISQFQMAPQMTEIYFLSQPTYHAPTGTLYSAHMGLSGVDNIVYIDEQVSHVIGTAGGVNQGVVYQTASRDDDPELIIYDSTPNGIVEISSQTSHADYAQIQGQNQEKILYYKDYQPSRRTGELYQYVDSEQLLADNNHQYLYFQRGEILLVQGKKSGKHQLLLLQDDTLYSIDENVGAYVSFDYDFFPETP